MEEGTAGKYGDIAGRNGGIASVNGGRPAPRDLRFPRWTLTRARSCLVRRLVANALRQYRRSHSARVGRYRMAGHVRCATSGRDRTTLAINAKTSPGSTVRCFKNRGYVVAGAQATLTDMLQQVHGKIPYPGTGLKGALET
eukprot:3819236-Rhodomonas_salina.5